MRNWKGIRRGAILAVLAGLLLWAVPASAALYGGYNYVCYNATPCDGVRYTYKHPEFTYQNFAGEAQNWAQPWAGIQGGYHGTITCINGALIQGGGEFLVTNADVLEQGTWKEQYPCNTIGYFGSINTEAGDTVSVEIICATNCTQGSTTSTWTYTWVNITKSLTATSTISMAGPPGRAVYMDEAFFVIETLYAYPVMFTEPMKIYKTEIHELGGAWVPIPFDPTLAAHAGKQVTGRPVIASPVTQLIYSPSPPIGKAGKEVWYLCSSLVVNTFVSTSTPCIVSYYKATNGFGP